MTIESPGQTRGAAPPLTTPSTWRLGRGHSGSRWSSLGCVVVLAAVTAAVTAFSDSSSVYTLTVCLIAILSALALNVLMGTAGQVSIGSAAFLAIGAYGVVYFSGLGIPFPLDIVLASLIAGAAGLVVGLPALRLRGLDLALSTLAAHFIVLFVAREYQAREAGTGGFLLDPIFADVDLDVSQIYWAWICFGLVAVAIVLSRNILRGRSGRAWRMIREHPDAAATLGIAVGKYKLVAFVISSVVIAVGGGLSAHLNSSVTIESFTLMVAIQLLAMILIGGLDSIVGAIIGAFVVVLLPEVVPRFLAQLDASDALRQQAPYLSQIIYGVLIIVFIVSSPRGIVGWWDGVRHGPTAGRLLNAMRQRPTSTTETTRRQHDGG